MGRGGGAWWLTGKVHGEGGAAVFNGIHDSVVRKELEELRVEHEAVKVPRV